MSLNICSQLLDFYNLLKNSHLDSHNLLELAPSTNLRFLSTLLTAH
jgi:hypothetical protein